MLANEVTAGYPGAELFPGRQSMGDALARVFVTAAARWTVGWQISRIVQEQGRALDFPDSTSSKVKRCRPTDPT